MFWFTFNLAVDFRTKMALTLEILSDQMHTLPPNSAEHTLFLFFASFRRSKSALCHLLCEATCSLRTDKQLGNNVTSVDEYSKIVTVQQLGVVSKTRNGVTGNGVTRNRVTGFFSFFQFVDDDFARLSAFLFVFFEWKKSLIFVFGGFLPPFRPLS